MNKYFIYARKSSEAEDKQVQSIDSQVNALMEIVTKGRLNVIEILTESGSAKKPGRPIFNTMLQRIQKGEANGVIVWHADRISRNSVDAGNFIYLMDLNQLTEIITPTKTYNNTPQDKMWLQFQMLQAKYENDEKGINVKRGMNSKVEKGWYPGPAPEGYKNTPDRDKGYKIILTDPNRFKLLRKAFDVMLEGTYTVPQVLDKLNNDWSYTTKKRRKTGGTPLARSTLYSIFTNPFYYGYFEYNGELCKGSHTPMITEEEYNKIQYILGRPLKQRPSKHVFAFTGIMKCGECGCAITATKRQKYFKKTNNHATYIYYHCTKKNKDIKCSQKPIKEDSLEKQIVDILKQIEIPIEFKEWALKNLIKLHDSEVKDRNLIKTNTHEVLIEIQNQLDELLKMRLKRQISEEKYIETFKELEKQEKDLKSKLNKTNERVVDWRKEVEKAIDFSLHADEWLQKGTPEEKKNVLASLGSNFVLKDRNLLLQMKKPFLRFKKAKEEGDFNIIRLKPAKNSSIKAKREYKELQNLKWLP